MSVDLEWYRVFTAVARCGNITRAAEELFLTQPAVSQCIRALERELSCTLFTRTARGVRLTREGEALYAHTLRGCEAIAQGEKVVRGMRDLESGSLSIGASDMTLQFFLLHPLERFHAAHPGVRISVTNGPTPETLDKLRRGRIDFGAVSSPLAGGNTLRITPYTDLCDVFVASPRAFPHLRGKTVTPAELCALPLICLEQNTSTRRFLDDWFGSQEAALAPEFELATSHLIVQFALRGLGVGSVVRDFAAAQLASGELFELTLAPAPPLRSVCLVTDPGAVLSAAAARFLDIMESYYSHK